jgi:branched-chain amino acid transport system permease protein
MDLALQLLANGLINGSQYALLGIGFGLIFGTTGIVHFAYGPIYACAAYVIWWLAERAGLPYVAAASLGVGVTGLLGVGAYLGLYRPFLRGGAPAFVVLVSSLGLYIVLTNGIAITFGTSAKTVDVSYGIYFLGETVVTGVQISEILALLVVGTLLMLFLRFTATGNALRAMADNMAMARIVGVNTERMTILVFALGSAISAIPAAHVLVRDGALPGMGFLAVFYAFVAVVVGGVGSIWGAALGGILVGMIESLGMWQIPSEWQSTIAFLVLFVVILCRPTGLFRAS